MRVVLGQRTVQVRTVDYRARDHAVLLIEQRRLPHHFTRVATRDYRETAAAIRDMVVRGAGAIGATAAFGLAQGARAFRGRDLERFRRHMDRVFETLRTARPTAVDPVNAMEAVRRQMQVGLSVAEQQDLALAAARAFADEDVAHCEAIGRHGAPLIREGMRVLTHCNAGALAFVDVGSATAPLYAAHAEGRRFHVFCNETRPRCQGATLTAWELAQQGISHQVLADNAAGHLMQHGEVDLVIVGSDRILGRTGEIANKIGTYTLAVLAHRHSIPFYVAAPLSTLDWCLRAGTEIPIEERDPAEVLGARGVPALARNAGQRPSAAAGRASRYFRVANPTSGARNPAFDLTSPDLITGILTPVGLLRPLELWRRRALLGGPPD